jgi:hypothetical protein
MARLSSRRFLTDSSVRCSAWMFLGGRAKVLAGRWRVHDRGRLCRRATRRTQPTERCAAAHRPCRSRPCGVSIHARFRTRISSRCSGRTTIRHRACVRATTLARSTDRQSITSTMHNGTLPSVRVMHISRNSLAQVMAQSRLKSRRPQSSTTPRTIISNICRRILAGTAALVVTGVSCPVGLVTK